MNIHESEKIAGILESLGYIETQETSDADIIIFNTCCIRDNAEQHAMGNIGAIKPLKKINPNIIVGVVGCMTQQDGAGLTLRKKFPFIDIVLGTSNIHLLEDCILDVKETRKKIVMIDEQEKPEVLENEKVYRTSGTNAWLNIMYGCNNFCTYCIVPYVRGRERSRKMSNIIDEFKMLLDQGYKEITLLGQNVNSYGSDLNNGDNFAKLLKEIAKFENYTKHRVRFMTSHPKDLSHEVVDIIAQSPSICNYIHLPIQSGSNKILKLMNRHYTREQYLETINYIKSRIPDCGITSDIMVAFPQEEECDFQDTLDIVKTVEYSGAFTFVYSMRKGTIAATMEQIDPLVAKDRIQRLIEEQNIITRKISQTYIGKTYEVLCEGVSDKDPNIACGRTESGRLVNFPGDSSMIGQFFDVYIDHAQSASLYGTIKK